MQKRKILKPVQAGDYGKDNTAPSADESKGEPIKGEPETDGKKTLGLWSGA